MALQFSKTQFEKAVNMNNPDNGVSKVNFYALKANSYPGRGIVAGLDKTGKHLIQIYWIMGRSENSRNRVFKSKDETGRVYTEAADAGKMKDPALVIYNAMRENGNCYIVSNGDQTDTVADSSSKIYFNLNGILDDRRYEPDAPNFTQRITAATLFTSIPRIQMLILRKSMLGSQCDRALFEYIPTPGFGHCITTYSGDGDPLPPFRGDPLLMPLDGSMEAIAQAYWSALNEDNRVSLAVKTIDIETGRSEIRIINKYTQTG